MLLELDYRHTQQVKVRGQVHQHVKLLFVHLYRGKAFLYEGGQFAEVLLSAVYLTVSAPIPLWASKRAK